MRTRLALSVVRGLMRALEPVWLYVLSRRRRIGKETDASVAQKTMRVSPIRPEGSLIWGHAVGLGEVLALAGLFRQLGVIRPDLSFLITSSARSSAEVLMTPGNLPPRCVHQFAPIDTPRVVSLFLECWRPDLAVWCEMDLWPILLDETSRRGIPRLLVNARVSARSLGRRRRVRALFRPLLAGFDGVWAQDEASIGGLIELGARAHTIQVTGTLKSMCLPPPVDPVEYARWAAALGGRRVWLLASSHEGEEALGLQAHQILRGRHPDALMIIAPRYPSRGSRILGECPGGTILRSADPKCLPKRSDSIYVADTLGEMGLWYRLAPVSFVGGSLVPVGGHNPYEPLSLACAVVHGPYVQNFAESYSNLANERRVTRVSDGESLATAVDSYWREARVSEGGPFTLAGVWEARLRALAAHAGGGDSGRSKADHHTDA